MTGHRFQPAGEKARWRIAFDIFATAERGTVVMYDHLRQEMACDQASMQAAVRQAVPRLEKQMNRTLTPVRGVGYRVVLPEGHIELARQHLDKARESTNRAKSKVEHVDLNGVPVEARQALTAIRDHVVRVSAALDSLNRSREEHEARIQRLERRLGVEPEPKVIDGETA